MKKAISVSIISGVLALFAGAVQAQEAEARAQQARAQAERAEAEAHEARTVHQVEEAEHEDRIREADRIDPQVDHKADDYSPRTPRDEA